MQKMTAKVRGSGQGALGGYTLGRAISALLVYYVLGEDVPEHVRFAVDFVAEALCTVGGSLLVGYWTHNTYEDDKLR